MRQIVFESTHGATYRYGLICGKEKFIVTETDFVHRVFDNTSAAELTVGVIWKKSGDGWATNGKAKTKMFSLAKLQADSRNIAVQKFSHYWGIKPRVRQNYTLLLDTMKQIGANVSQMPEWGA